MMILISMNSGDNFKFEIKKSIARKEEVANAMLNQNSEQSKSNGKLSAKQVGRLLAIGLKAGELTLFYENMMYGTTDKMIINYRYFTSERLRAKVIEEVME